MKYKDNSKEMISLPAAINIAINKTSNCYQYRLIIYNSKLSKILFNKKEKAKLLEKDNHLYLIKDTSGNILNSSPKHQTVFMSIGKMMPKNKNNSASKEKSNTTKIKLKLNPQEWGLDSLDIFLAAKEERELAKELISLGFDVIPITYNDKDKLINACADLLISKGQIKTPVEITTTAPSSRDIKAGINSPHGHQWSKVAGRILPLVLHSAENKKPSFLIMNKEWENYNHVNYLKNSLERFKCYIISSDFNGDWANKIANKIQEHLEK